MPDSTPRNRRGALSIAYDAPMPQYPPMPMPYSARQITNIAKLGASPLTTVHSEKYRIQTISGRLRPNLSAREPKNNAPSGRIASVKVSVYTTDDFGTWKRPASVSNRNTITKKSNESSTQPRIPEPTASLQPLVSRSILVSVPVTNAMSSSPFPLAVYSRLAVNSIACQVERLYPAARSPLQMKQPATSGSAPSPEPPFGIPAVLHGKCWDMYDGVHGNHL